MNNLLKLNKREKKLLNRLLETVNFSLDVLEGLKWRKIYWVLKKASKLLEWNDIEKSEIKLIAKSLSSNATITNKQRREAISRIVELEDNFDAMVTYETQEPKQSNFIKWFFDLKQVFIC